MLSVASSASGKNIGMLQKPWIMPSYRMASASTPAARNASA